MNDTTNKAHRARKVVLSLPQRIAAFNKLKEVCTKTAEGKARYAPGWSDAKMATTMGAPFKENHIAYIRSEMIGDLESRSVGADTADLDARLRNLEEYITRTGGRC